MPSRKQRRRRDKERRHDYEYVYVDEAGREVAIDDDELDTPAARRNGSAATNGAAGGASRSARGGSRPRAGAQPRSTRTAQPPSWTRVLKRGAIFAPIMLLTIAFLERGLGPAAVVLVTLQMLVIFVPFSYLLDRTMYRRALAREEAARASSRPGRRR